MNVSVVVKYFDANIANGDAYVYCKKEMLISSKCMLSWSVFQAILGHFWLSLLTTFPTNVMSNNLCAERCFVVPSTTTKSAARSEQSRNLYISRSTGRPVFLTRTKSSTSGLTIIRCRNRQVLEPTSVVADKCWNRRVCWCVVLVAVCAYIIIVVRKLSEAYELSGKFVCFFLIRVFLGGNPIRYLHPFPED